MLSDLRSAEERIHSQGGEDGVLLRLFEALGATNRYFVEFGAKDGTFLSNTANLRLHHGWNGLLMDAGAERGDALVTPAFVTAENVESLFSEHGVPAHFDLLSIDIDGNDYWVWKALRAFTPRVVIVEYNIFFGPDECRTIPYDAEHRWEKDSPYHGASLAALAKLGREKGYALIHTDSFAPNAVFVLRSELPARFAEPPLEELLVWAGFDAPPALTARPWLHV